MEQMNKAVSEGGCSVGGLKYPQNVYCGSNCMSSQKKQQRNALGTLKKLLFEPKIQVFL